ncbi:MAG: AMP-binding protein [Rhabdochlamydiaceae bacterium]|jgi:O-succinylbenzoic acid--CoA ligase
MKLLTDTKKWSHEEFEAHVEGMCATIQDIPDDRIAFVAHPTPEVIFLFFALWKLKKIACPLSPRLPSVAASIEELDAYFITPPMPIPKKPTPWTLQGNQPATLLFTSGSAGKPKIACHSINNHLYSALGARAIIELLPEDTWHLSLPLFI